MWKRPADRPQSMTDVIAMLKACRSSATDQEEVRAGLTTYAARVFKRASPRRRDLERNPSVFARPSENDNLWFNPDLRLEDLITDYRPDVPTKPLPEEKLPPRLPRIRAPRKRPQHSPALLGLAAIAVLGLCAFGYMQWIGHSPKPDETRGIASAPTLEAASLKRDDSALRIGPETTIATSPGQSNRFQQLFNGADLTGWKTHPSQPGNWHVENGILVGSGPGAVSHLYSVRDDYQDFHLRAEVRTGDTGNSGVYFPPVSALRGPRTIGNIRPGMRPRSITSQEIETILALFSPDRKRL